MPANMAAEIENREEPNNKRQPAIQRVPTYRDEMHVFKSSTGTSVFSQHEMRDTRVNVQS